MINQQRLNLKIAGFLILLGIIIGLFSVVPVVESQKFLGEVYLNKNQVFIGAIFQFFLIPIYIGFALLIYPILQWYSKPLSIGFLGFRFMAGAFQMMGITLLPLFVLLSQIFSTSTSSDIYVLELNGELLKLFRDLINHVGVIFSTGIGNLFLYLILYKGKLIPHWISVLGILGNLLIMIAGFLLLAQKVEVISGLYLIMSIPLVIQEIIFALFLLVKGMDLKSNQRMQ